MPRPRRKYYRPPIRKVRSAIKKTEKQFTSQDVAEAFQRSDARRLQLFLFDRTYWVVTEDTWKTILQYNGVDREQYITERYDCDDFSFGFKGGVATKLKINSVGLVVDYSGGHAYCAILVHDNGELRVDFIEPQNDKYVVKGKGMSKKEIYAMERGMVIF